LKKIWSSLRKGAKQEKPGNIHMQSNDPKERSPRFARDDKDSAHAGADGLHSNGSPDTVRKDLAGWVSPSYTHSRTAYLNPLIAAANGCVAASPDSTETEVFKVIRTHILNKTVNNGGRTIMVTSAVPGEGKTLTTVNLAFTFAREFQQTVLLVDGDLRRQHIHRVLGLDTDSGLASYFLENRPLADLIVWPGVEKLTVISGGPAVRDSAELVGSPRMKDLIREMKNRYPERYIFFDVPPVLTAADALAFARLMDHIVLVVAAGSTSMYDVRRALEVLPEEKILGLVLNRSGH